MDILFCICTLHRHVMYTLNIFKLLCTSISFNPTTWHCSNRSNISRIFKCIRMQVSKFRWNQISFEAILQSRDLSLYKLYIIKIFTRHCFKHSSNPASSHPVLFITLINVKHIFYIKSKYALFIICYSVFLLF